MYVQPPNMDWYEFEEDFNEETEALATHFIFMAYNQNGKGLMNFKATTTPEQKNRVKAKLDEWRHYDLIGSFYLSNLAF